MLICPVCSEQLNKNAQSYTCKNGHNFDISSSGYCNLLISSKSGQWIGDNKDMVTARRNFLDSGAYAPLRDALCRYTSSLSMHKNISAVDAGCGEGYYTRAIASCLAESAASFQMIGIDISKAATQYAAKRDKLTSYITASSYHMPIRSDSCDFVFSLFAPTPASEFSRILRSDGVVIQVAPGKEHLFELKKAVYDTPYFNEEDKHTLNGFRLRNKQKLVYKTVIDSKENISALFSMTPYAHRTPKEGIDRLARIESIELTLSFVILTFEKE